MLRLIETVSGGDDVIGYVQRDLEKSIVVMKDCEGQE